MATKTIPAPLFREESAQNAISIMEAAVPERNEFGMSNSIWKECLGRSLNTATRHGSTFRKGRVYLDERLGWKRASLYVVNEVTGRTRHLSLTHTSLGVTAEYR